MGNEKIFVFFRNYLRLLNREVNFHVAFLVIEGIEMLLLKKEIRRQEVAGECNILPVEMEQKALLARTTVYNAIRNESSMSVKILYRFLLLVNEYSI